MFSRSSRLPIPIVLSVDWLRKKSIRLMPSGVGSSMPTNAISPAWATDLIDCAMVPEPSTSTTRSTPRPSVRASTSADHSGS